MSEPNNATNQPLRVYSGGRRVTEFSQINIHHNGSRYRNTTVNGKREKVRSDGRVDGGVAGVDSSGIDRVAKDLVLQDKNGNASVNVPTSVSGTVKLTPTAASGGYGNMAEILNDRGQVVARFAHLQKFNPELKSGQTITRGTSLGIQGTTGHSTGIHLHAEMPASEWPSYVRDLVAGRFGVAETTAVSNSTAKPASQPSQIYSGNTKVTEFSEINQHHDGPRYQTVIVDGKEERVRSDGRVDGGEPGLDSSGITRVVKDVVLKDANGSTTVNVPAAVSGTLKLTPSAESGGYGNMAEILNTQGQVVARFAHLQDFNPALKSGQTIERGTNLGVQGTTGRSVGVHLHAEMPATDWSSYVSDLAAGKFAQTQSSMTVTAPKPESQHAVEQESTGEPVATAPVETPVATNEQQLNNYSIVAAVIQARSNDMSKLGLDVINSPADLDVAIAAYAKINGLDREGLLKQSPIYQSLSDTAATAYQRGTFNKADAIAAGTQSSNLSPAQGNQR